MKFKLSTKVMTLVCVPIIFQLVFVGALGTVLHQLDVERAQEAHARELANHFNTLLRSLMDVFTSQILVHLMKNDTTELRRKRAQQLAQNAADNIRALIAGNPLELEGFERIVKLQARLHQLVKQAENEYHEGDRLQAMLTWNRMLAILDQHSASIDNMIMAQEQIEASTKASQAELRLHVQQIIFAAIVINIAFAIGFATLLNKSTARRLETLMDNALRLSAEQPLNPPLDGSDEIAQLDKVLHDVTAALADSRRKERAVIDNAADVIFSLDAKGRFVVINPACAAVWGFEPGELIGKRFVEVLHDDESERTRSRINKMIENAQDGSVETKLVYKDGTAANSQWTVHWSATENALFCVAHDITERKQIEQKKREFMAMVSHDLRTPLATIQMIHSMIGAKVYGELNEQGCDRLAVAESNVDRLLAMVNDLLDLEKVDAGKLQVYPESIDVESVVSPAAAAVMGIAAKQGVNVKTELDETEDIDVFADRDRVIQVLVNLISNAIKFSPAGSTVIVRTNDEIKAVRFSVIDQGRGITPEFMPKLFERFKQSETDDSRKKGGAGLGLSICKAIVECHGGTIGVESETGKGSTFWFVLPKSAA